MTETLPSDSPAPARYSHHLRISTQWPEFDLALISVTGEIDAANADTLLHYALSKALLCNRMVLDLTELGFFGCVGGEMLTTLQRRCIMADVDLTIRTGPAVRRTLFVIRAGV